MFAPDEPQDRDGPGAAPAGADRVLLTRGRMLAAVASSVMGWSFDLFDLFILLYVAPAVGAVLFPTSSPTLSLAIVYASFAVSLLMRPFGGGLFGRIADRRGRHGILLLTISGAGVSTALMGAVPSYRVAGAVGPVIFIVLRLIQGLFIGGVVASTHTIGTESVPERWRGVVSGLIGGAGPAFGAVLASVLLIAVAAAFPGAAFNAWGWRVMFFSAIVVAAVADVVFTRVQESPLWVSVAATGAGLVTRGRVRELASRAYRRITGLSLLVVFGAGAQYYLTSGYLPTLFADVDHIRHGASGLILIGDSLVILGSTILVGHLSQWAGRRPTMITVGVVNLVALPILAWRLTHVGAAGTGAVTGYSLAFVFLANMAYAPVLVFLNERFPTRIRATGTALIWNVGFAIGGLMTTFVSLASPTFSALPSRLLVFLVGTTAVFLIGALLAPETRGALARENAAGTAVELPRP